MKNNPGKVWRRAPEWGEDNGEILQELGFSQEEISGMYADHTLGGQEK